MAKPRRFWTLARRIAKSKVESNELSLTLLIECGSGKSSLPPALAYDLRRIGAIESLVWLTPRSNLCTQAAESMNVGSPKTRFVWDQLLGVPHGIAKQYAINHLDDGNPQIGIDLAAGTFGYTCTYDTFVSQLAMHLQFIESHNALVIADEIQLCREGTPWGKAIANAKEASAFFVAMSGDFDRPRGYERVAGVTYRPHREDDSRYEVQCDVEYNIHDALSDRAIVRMDFVYGNGEVTFNRDDKPIIVRDIEACKSDDVRDVIRAVTDPQSKYALELLAKAVESWKAHRTTGLLNGRSVKPQPNAKLLVVCKTQDDAREVHAILTKHMQIPIRECGVAVSDDTKAAKDAIESFRQPGGLTCLVTVAMAYIGMDVRAITHLCSLTNYRSPAWLHQMLARAWRRSDDADTWEDDYCVCFAPRDPKWQSAIEKIKRAIQIGVYDKEPGEGPVSGESRTKGHKAHLEYTKAMYEFLCEGIVDIEEIVMDEADYEESDTIESVPADVQEIREMLLTHGRLDSYTVERMLAAMATEPIEDPIEDQRTPNQRRKDLNRELVDDLAVVAAEVKESRSLSDISKACKIVNGEMRKQIRQEWGYSWDREKVKHDESRLQHSIAVLVPRVRRILVGE